MISSIRLRNSGLKVLRRSESMFDCTRWLLWSSSSEPKPTPRTLVGLAAAHVAGHDQHRVAEVDRAAEAVGQLAVLQHLQQDVEDVRVGLLDLVEQDHRVGLAPHLLGEHAALVVAHVARRRADQAADTECFSMYSDMSTRISEDWSPKRNSVRRRATSVLPTPVGPRKMNEPMGRRGSRRPARLRRMALETASSGLVLADDPLAQLLLHAQQLVGLLLLDLGHRDAGDVGDDPADQALVDHGACCSLVLGVPVLLEVLRASSSAPSPRRGSAAAFSNSWAWMRGLLLRDDLLDPLLDLAQIRRHHGHAQARAAAGLVDDVDGLVRQGAAGDVAVGEADRGRDGVVVVLDPVVRLVLVAQAEQDLDGLLLAWAD